MEASIEQWHLDILRFWFGNSFFECRADLDTEGYLKQRGKMWYMGGSKIDIAARQFLRILREERSRFERSGQSQNSLQPLREESALAQIILFDQIARNAARGTVEAFQQDVFASAISEKLIFSGFSSRCRAAELLFLVQPLVHAETPSSGVRAQAAISILHRELYRFSSNTSKRLARAADVHSKHLEVLEQFGRYPHRNLILGRASTVAEEQWLKSPQCPGWARSQIQTK